MQQTAQKYFLFFGFICKVFFCNCIQISFQAFAHLVLLAAGTGITPMLQIASATLSNPSNKSHITLLSFSTNDQDVCLYQDLVDMQNLSSSTFTLKLFASQLSSAGARVGVVKGSTRSLTAQQLLQHAGVPNFETTCFCMCGPSDWMAATQQLLQQGGALADHILAWT